MTKMKYVFENRESSDLHEGGKLIDGHHQNVVRGGLRNAP